MNPNLKKIIDSTKIKYTTIYKTTITRLLIAFVLILLINKSKFVFSIKLINPGLDSKFSIIITNLSTKGNISSTNLGTTKNTKDKILPYSLSKLLTNSKE